MQRVGLSYGFGRPWTPVVRGLILANIAIHLLGLLDPGRTWVDLFGLDTGRVFAEVMPWQLFTYQFLHDNAWHLVFNMFALWMFGSEVEDYLGKGEFLAYYLLTGVGAGLCQWSVDALLGERSLAIGASGAIFGVLAAYGVLFARRRITLLVFLVIPVAMEARVMVAILAALELFLGVSQRSSGVARVAHLGGMLAGWVYLRFLRRPLRPLLVGRGVGGGLLARLSRSRGRRDLEKLDALLDKVNRYGIHTLTPGEREFLDRVSRRPGGAPGNPGRQ